VRFATPGISVYKIRLCYPWILDVGLLSLPPLAGHGGEEKRKDGASTCVFGGRQGSSSSLVCRHRVRPVPLSSSAVLSVVEDGAACFCDAPLLGSPVSSPARSSWPASVARERSGLVRLR
jgi:hypothetical protein